MKKAAIILASALALIAVTGNAAQTVKTVQGDPIVLKRGVWEFGPLTSTVSLQQSGPSARINLTYAIAVERAGRVYQRSDRPNDTNGPLLNLELIDASGAVIARVDGFLAPTWSCHTLSTGSRTGQIAISPTDFEKVAGYRLVDTGGAWKEEGCN